MYKIAFVISGLISFLFIIGGVLSLIKSRARYRTAVFSVMIIAGYYFAIFSLRMWYMPNPQPEWGIAVASVPWLDKRASNISYYRFNNVGLTLACEFNISLIDFEALAKEKEWKIAPISKPHSIIRYCDFHAIPKLNEDQLFEIKKGFIYKDLHSNGGGITVIFDAIASKAYIFQCPR